MNLSEAIKQVSAELSKMPRDEFMAEFEKHWHGDIARIVRRMLSTSESLTFCLFIPWLRCPGGSCEECEEKHERN